MNSNNPYGRLTPQSTSNSTAAPSPSSPPPSLPPRPRPAAQAASEPLEAPPDYATATHTGSSSLPQAHAHLEIPTTGRASSEYSSDTDGEDSVIPRADRLSMQDEARPLPEGWIRQYDSRSQHWYYVDTRASPPRAIWVHPYQDRDYVLSLPETSEVRQYYSNLLAGAQDSKSAAYSAPAQNHGRAEGSHVHHAGPSTTRPPSGGAGVKSEEKKTVGRKFKDKLTGMTHEDRVQQRKLQQERELEEYKSYLTRRQALADQQQQSVYSAPSSEFPQAYRNGPYAGQGYSYNQRYGAQQYGGQGYYDNSGYGYNQRRGGSGFGGAGLGLAGGLLGGLLLGDLLF